MSDDLSDQVADLLKSAAEQTVGVKGKPETIIHITPEERSRRKANASQLDLVVAMRRRREKRDASGRTCGHGR